jgi:hypothetical protein
MTGLRQSRPILCIVIICIAIGLSLGQGCARSEPHPSDAGTAVSQQKLPFHPPGDKASGVEGVHPAVWPEPNSPEGKKPSAVPFGSRPHILPSGTLLTVQLESPLSTAHVRDGDTFTASVAAPLAIDGDSLIERGALATGHVESVRAQAGSGYFQLKLSTIAVEGRQLTVQTSSLFAQGTSQQPDGVRVQKGRRLTFRLTSPVALNEPKSVANRQSLGAPTE